MKAAVRFRTNQEIKFLYIKRQPARPRPTALLPPRSYGKPEAAAAVDRLLIIGKRMPET